ncbi:hypothetical protein IJM86_00460 [bacterium]|nr:hypothetical protein [bacterium]
MTREEKEELVDKLGNIQVVNNTKTTKNIINALGKAEQFIKATGELKQQATISLKNINEPLQIFESLGFNITNRISESSFLKGIADFFCSAIGFPGGFEGFKRERDLMNGTYHTDESPDSEDEDKTENNGEEDKDDKNTLSETKILEQAKKNLENLITFQEQFLKDYESEISPKEKKEFERLIEDTKELQNNDDFSLAKYQKEVENLTKKTKDQTKKYLTTNDDKAPLQAIFDENKAIRKKMEEFRKQEKKGKDEKTDSQSSDI